MDFIKSLFSREGIKKSVFFIVIILFLYLTRSVLNLMLLTFLFTYLINSLENLIIRQFKKYVFIKKKILTIILYIIIFTSIVIILYKFVPIIINQSISIINQAEDFYLYKGSQDLPKHISKYLMPALEQIDIKNYTKSGVDFALKAATNIGRMSINVFIALILSLFFILEKDKVMRFIHKFKDSKLSTAYDYFSYYGNNFLNSFGKVIKAQIVIAFANTFLSVLMLSIMGFPKLLALGFMIFILSLIPVAGVIISLVPLCLIAFRIGGFAKVVYVLIMVGVIHGIESYVLNPKLMSAKTELPIFFTFIILIISEHFMGIWGLLLGIPLFMFVLDLLDVKVSEEAKKITNPLKKIKENNKNQ